MCVPDWRMEQQSPKQAQYRIAEIPMQQRHRSRLNAAAKAIAHSEVGPISQFSEKARNVGELVTVVCIGDEHIATASCFNACIERCSISPWMREDHARTMSTGNLRRTICRAIVGYNNFTADVIFAQGSLSLPDADRQCLRLV